MSASRNDIPPQLHRWLTAAVEVGASDVHLVVGHAPTLRLHGNLVALEEPVLVAGLLEQWLSSLCPAHVLDHYLVQKNADFALEVPIGQETRRFRVNFFVSGQQFGACFRIIPAQIPEFEWAGFPRQVAVQLAHFRNGLVLVSGVTGAGKTTSLAMIINLLNREGGYRIITVEEPIEYLFPKNPHSIVTQREVGQDVLSFADGLKYGLRQDPDIILVGEIRDRETAQLALSAAETGHLVFSTLHTRDAKGAISRYADLFPQSVQGDVRSQLSMCLRAVVSQHLLPSADPDSKRELAIELLYNNAPIASAIRFGKIESIDNNILTGRAEGMITLNESVRRLMHDGRISAQVAERFVTDKSFLYK